MPSVNVKVIEPHTSQITTSERDSDKGGNPMSAHRLLQMALAVFGATFLLIYPLAIVWPSGWAWHPGAPYESQYFMMIVGVYATLGVSAECVEKPSSPSQLDLVHSLVERRSAAASWRFNRCPPRIVVTCSVTCPLSFSSRSFSAVCSCGRNTGKQSRSARPRPSEFTRPSVVVLAVASGLDCARSGNVPNLLENGGHSWCEPDSPSSGFRMLGDS